MRMCHVPRLYDVPAVGTPFAVRGLRGAVAVLDEFTPTHLDAWLGRVLLADGAPSPAPAAGTARALVVRHGGNVMGRPPLRRSRLQAVLAVQPPPTPLAGIVVEERSTTLVWLPERDPALLARELSRAEWRSFL